MALTREQDRAVRTVDRDLCVVAGAGSGKTSVLTERFVHLALDRGAALDRILTLTFTDRAAVEMRERVARRFGERGRHDLRRETASAWIGTFHSFCARLLKENAIEAGVDPSFTVLAEAGAETLLDRALEAAVDRLREEAPESLAPLALLSTTREGLEADLGRLLDRCRGLDGDPAAALAAEAAPPDPAAGLAALRRALGDLRDGLDSYRDAGWKRATAVLEAARGLDGIDPGDAAALGAAAGAVVASVNLQCGAPAKERLRAAKAAGEALLGDLVALRAAPVAASLATLLSALDAAYAAERAARGAMDFHDLERRALDLLRDDPGVREEVRARFDHLLVDEFQDTNPVQEALLGLLRTPRRTFVVGDPKQAIYGFRGADHGGFARALEAAGEGGTVRLRENFRSRPEILSFAGAVLEPAFAAGAPVQVPWQPLLPGASFGPKGIPSVEVHLVEGEEPTGALREREARMLAGRLHSLVEGRAASITARTPGGDPGGRPLRWGDAAVLLRALTDLKVYERAFAERDLPFLVVGGR
ncbi:MAG: UvrD-helicase domain-containing protein, partial [Planctomycetes bacterium]|nr:UvrD-helicase domain-containing protein [Planctomycetota bacterium]